MCVQNKITTKKVSKRSKDASNTTNIEDSNLEITTSEMSSTSISIWKSQFPNSSEFPIEDFLHIGFTHHGVILAKVKNIDERIYYIMRCATEHYSVDALKKSIADNDYQHQSTDLWQEC